MSTEPLLTNLDRQTIAVSKALAADAVEKAGSGHPGTPISLAGVAWLLYQREMVHDPADPACPMDRTNRSRPSHPGSAGSWTISRW